MKLLELIAIAIYRLTTRVRIYWIAKRYGYRITEFEWLPASEKDERIVRITPKDDFKHGRDICACNPSKTLEIDDEGREYTLIQHKEIFNDAPA